jgi:hypothetical protein
VNEHLTPAELADRINEGVAYCCELSGARRASNFVCPEVISTYPWAEIALEAANGCSRKSAQA